MLQRHIWLTALAVVLAAGGLASACLAAEEAKTVHPGGTWKWENTRREFTVKSTLRLKLKDGKILGTYKGRGDEVEIEEAKIDGDMVSFRITRGFDDLTFTVTYRGKISEDTIKGELEWSVGDRSGIRPWEAKRVVEMADILGTWKLKVTTEDGNSFEPTVTFTKDGDKLKGAYSSQWGDRDAENVLLKDNVLSFEISGETAEDVFLVTYKGRPRGDSITGTLEYDFGGQSGTRPFKGQRQEEKKKAKEKSDEKDEK